MVRFVFVLGSCSLCSHFANFRFASRWGVSAILEGDTQNRKELSLVCHVHHVHIFASDIDKSIKFYEEFFGGEVILDSVLAGERNVFVRIGNGRLHLYDQPPKNPVRGNIHHFGIQTDKIQEVVNQLKSKGVVLKKDITDLGFWKYIMVPAPDEILIELFEVDKTKLPPQYVDYFE